MQINEKALKPCPFCGTAMMLRGALWPSEGDRDAVIHAEPTDCPLPHFSNDTFDGSIVEVWNRRAEAVTPPDVAGLIDVLVECAEMVEDGRQDGLTQFWHDETAKLTAKTCLEAATALRLSAGGGWRSMDSAPELDRVIVAGWQKPTRSCAGYWWMHEDVIINGRPDERPDALLWHPFPARPTGLPASPTVEAGHVE